jgi:hypothetical protein
MGRARKKRNRIVGLLVGGAAVIPVPAMRLRSIA